MQATPKIVDPLGDGISRFAVVDHMGSDRLIAEAAWVEEPGSTRGQNEDEVARIVKYMMRHEHTSPYYHPQECLYFKMPVTVLRQADRHQIGFAWPRNEESRRYKTNEQSPFEFYIPEAWRGKSATRKQGSEGEAAVDGYTRDWLENHVAESTELYDALIKEGVAPEMARGHMPLCMYTSFYVTASLWAILHFLDLRYSEHAQWEIHQYAAAMLDATRELFPVTVAAWEQMNKGHAHA